MAQLRYLEELIKAEIFADTGLSGQATDWLYDRYNENGTIGQSDVQEFESLLFLAAAAAKSLTVSCVAHAHIDMNWM